MFRFCRLWPFLIGGRPLVESQGNFHCYRKQLMCYGPEQCTDHTVMLVFSWLSGFDFAERWSGWDGGRPAPVRHPASATGGRPAKRRAVHCSGLTPHLSFSWDAVFELGPGGNANKRPGKGRLCHPVPGQASVEAHSPSAAWKSN